MPIIMSNVSLMNSRKSFEPFLHSADLSPTNYQLCRHLDHFLRENKFHNKNSIENGFLEFVNTKDLKLYSKRVEKLLTRLQKSILMKIF